MSKTWISSIDAPTLRSTDRIESELYSLQQVTESRLEIINKRFSWLEDKVHAIYDTDEEDSPSGKRLIALAGRVSRHKEELEWRLNQIGNGLSLMGEIRNFVIEVACKPKRGFSA